MEKNVISHIRKIISQLASKVKQSCGIKKILNTHCLKELDEVYENLIFLQVSDQTHQLNILYTQNNLRIGSEKKTEKSGKNTMCVFWCISVCLGGELFRCQRISLPNQL